MRMSDEPVKGLERKIDPPETREAGGGASRKFEYDQQQARTSAL